MGKITDSLDSARRGRWGCRRARTTGETGACGDNSVCGRENRVFRDARPCARDVREDARARDVDANVFLASKTRGFADARDDARREGAVDRSGGS